MKLIKQIDNEDWYQGLIEDLDSIITERIKRSREELLLGYHEVGTRLLQEFDNFQRHRIYGSEITSRVSQSIGKSKRTVERAVQFARKFPEFNDVYALEEGENISWNKVVNKYLPEHTEEKEPEVTYVCPTCGTKLSRRP